MSDNMVRDRIVSIMSVWLAHYMAKEHSGKGYNFFIVSEKRWTGEKAPRAKGNQILRANCLAGVAARARSLDCLIGGTTVYYEDIEGRTV
jgi:hypothetical protein